MRTFIAINLPDDERRAVFAAAAALRDADLPLTWVEEDNLHVTLRFLGEVAEDRVQPMGDALITAVRGVKPFDVTLGGGGAFPDLKHPRVVWMGVERHPALELLANDVERVVGAFGFEPELRPFHPHLTLGRAKSYVRDGALRPLGEKLESLDYGGLLPVTSVDLMQSRTGPKGSHYTVLRRAELAGGR